MERKRENESCLFINALACLSHLVVERYKCIPMHHLFLNSPMRHSPLHHLSPSSSSSSSSSTFLSIFLFVSLIFHVFLPCFTFIETVTMMLARFIQRALLHKVNVTSFVVYSKLIEPCQYLSTLSFHSSITSC